MLVRSVSLQTYSTIAGRGNPFFLGGLLECYLQHASHAQATSRRLFALLLLLRALPIKRAHSNIYWYDTTVARIPRWTKKTGTAPC